MTDGLSARIIVASFELPRPIACAKNGKFCIFFAWRQVLAAPVVRQRQPTPATVVVGRCSARIAGQKRRRQLWCIHCHDVAACIVPAKETPVRVEELLLAGGGSGVRKWKEQERRERDMRHHA
eukprot:SAG11_NODE_2078_length_3855_cov_2.006124_2_plen_123_part_00